MAEGLVPVGGVDPREREPVWEVLGAASAGGAGSCEEAYTAEAAALLKEACCPHTAGVVEGVAEG